MRKRTRYIVVAVLTILLVVSLPMFPLYYLREDCGGQLLWRDGEAYLFMEVARRGYRMKLGSYPWVALSEWLGAVMPPSDERVLLTAVRITPSKVEPHIVAVGDHPGELPDLFTPVGENIYANCGGALCKFVTDRFERAPAGETQTLNGINALVTGDLARDGWSKRGVGLSVTNSVFFIPIGDGATIQVQLGDLTHHVKLDLTGRDGIPKIIWDSETEPRRVGRSEYEHAFSQN